MPDSDKRGQMREVAEMLFDKKDFKKVFLFDGGIWVQSESHCRPTRDLPPQPHLISRSAVVGYDKPT